MIKESNLELLRDILGDRLLSSGASYQNWGDKMCVQELVAVATGEFRTDTPSCLAFDIRYLNDAGWSSDELRTQTILPLAATLMGSASWSTERKLKFIEQVAIGTVNKVLPKLFLELGLEKGIEACEAATTLASAAKAANAIANDSRNLLNARAASANAAASAANATYASIAGADIINEVISASSANAARVSATARISDEVLIIAVQVWLDAANLSEGEPL